MFAGDNAIHTYSYIRMYVYAQACTWACLVNFSLYQIKLMWCVRTCVEGSEQIVCVLS